MSDEKTKTVMEQAEAESRLNRAAPDLLAALKRVGCQDDGSCGANEPDGECFVCMALARAEGRS